MKTLTQIEPRTAIESLPFTISQSGSYYFTKNLNFTATSGDAIIVSASDVTIDLMGFTLSSSAGVTGNGISISLTARRCTVKNGNVLGTTTVTITGSHPNRTWTESAGGFTYGVGTVSGSCKEARFLDLTVSKCRGVGLFGDLDSVAARCVATENGNTGIAAGAVTQCTAARNNGNGISGSTVTNSTASFNASHGISVNFGVVSGCNGSSNSSTGIEASFGSVVNCRADGNDDEGITARSVSGSVASLNGTFGILGDSTTNSTAESNGTLGIFGETITHCTARLNGTTGIKGETVIGCNARENTGHGIHVTGTARDNECSLNGKDAGLGAGIFFNESGVRVEGNNCFDNDWGIQSTAGVSSFIVRNSCRSNSTAPINAAPATANFDFDRASNTYGPVLVVNGDLSANAANSHPAINIQY